MGACSYLVSTNEVAQAKLVRPSTLIIPHTKLFYNPSRTQFDNLSSHTALPDEKLPSFGLNRTGTPPQSTSEHPDFPPCKATIA